MSGEILEALTEQPPTPCEHTQCRWLDLCGTQRMSCQRFARYVERIVPRTPLKFRDWQNAVYYPPGSADYQPSREIHERIYVSTDARLGRPPKDKGVELG
jgi:hypothetical protein